MMINRINLICLGVKDLDKSLAFYKALGFKTKATTGATIVFFNNDGTKLELFPIKNLAKDINEEHPPNIQYGGFSGITLACNMKTKEAVDDVMNFVESLGGKIVKVAQVTAWGGYSGYFQDLDGYYWEVAYGDMWQFDDQNMLIIDA